MWFAFFCFPERAGPGLLLACVVVPFSCLPCCLLSLYLLLFCFCCVLPFPLLGFARFCFPPHCWPVPLWGRHLCCCAALRLVAFLPLLLPLLVLLPPGFLITLTRKVQGFYQVFCACLF